MELVNQYCNGYVITPIIEACKKYGLFELLENKRRRKRQAIIKELHANEGYLTVALQALGALGYLETDNHDTCRLRNNVSISSNNFDLATLYAIDPKQLLSNAGYARMFAEKIEQILRHAKKHDSQLAGFAEGAIVVPLFVFLKQFNSRNICSEIAQIESRLSRSIAKLFVRRGWMTSDKRQLTTTGKQLLEAPEFESVLSFRRLLSSMEVLLFGDRESAHRQIPDTNEQTDLRSDDMGRKGCVNQLKEELAVIFDQLPLEQQPQTLVYFGCGDGLLLREVCLLIRNTIRGQHFAEFPLKFIVVDYDQHELDKASALLTKEGIDHKTLPGDKIGRAHV